MTKDAHNPAAGFTLLEVLIVVAIMGVLLSIGFVNLPRDRYDVQQAAQRTARDVQLARFEAMRRGDFVGIHPLMTRFSTGIYSGNGYIIFVDEEPRNYQFDSADTVITQVDFSEDSTAQLYQGYTTSTPVVVFDPRGVISRGQVHLQFLSRDRSYQRWVCINRQGDARIMPAVASC